MTPQAPLQKLKSVFNRVSGFAVETTTHPAVLFSWGNFLFALMRAEATGIAVSGGAAAVITGMRMFEQVTKRPAGVPFYANAACAAITGGSVIARGVQEQGAAAMMAFAPDARMSWMMGTALFFACLGNVQAARLEKNQKKSEGVIDNPQFYNNVCNVLLTTDSKVGMGIFAAGFLRSLWPGGGGTLMRHVTPARLSAAGYVAGAFAAGDAVAAAPYALWAAGYACFDKDENKEIRSGITRACGIGTA